MGRSITVAIAVLLLALSSACGSVQVSPAQLPADPDVVSLLPRQVTSLVVAQPRALFAAPATRLLVTRLVPDARFEALRVQHGIDLRTLDQLIVASYDDGNLFVLQGPFLAHVAVAEIAHRMIPVESRSESPRARVGGVFRGTRIDAIALGPHTLAVVAGPPALTGRLIASVDGASPAFDAVELRSLPQQPPFAWLRPLPLELPVDAPIAILLARQRTTRVTIVPDPRGTIALTVRFTGEFPAGAEANFRQLAASLAQTDLGRAVGLGAALPSLRVGAEPTHVEIEAALGAEGLSRGLWIAMGAEIAEALADTDEGPGIGP